jgi:hypothetical protein
MAHRKRLMSCTVYTRRSFPCMHEINTYWRVYSTYASYAQNLTNFTNITELDSMVAPAWRPRPEGWRRQPASCWHSRSGTPPDRSSRHLNSRVEICFPTRNSSNPGVANDSKLDFCLVIIRVVTGFKLRFFTANFFVGCYGSHYSRLLGGF